MKNNRTAKWWAAIGKFGPALVFTVVSTFSISSGVAALSRNAPRAAWVPPITVGILLLLVPIGVGIKRWAGLPDASVDGFNLTTILYLSIFGLWIVAGLVLISLGYSTFTVTAYTGLGIVAVAIVPIQRFRKLNQASRAE